MDICRFTSKETHSFTCIFWLQEPLSESREMPGESAGTAVSTYGEAHKRFQWLVTDVSDWLYANARNPIGVEVRSAECWLVQDYGTPEQQILETVTATIPTTEACPAGWDYPLYYLTYAKGGFWQSDDLLADLSRIQAHWSGCALDAVQPSLVVSKLTALVTELILPKASFNRTAEFLRRMAGFGPAFEQGPDFTAPLSSLFGQGVRFAQCTTERYAERYHGEESKCVVAKCATAVSDAMLRYQLQVLVDFIRETPNSALPPFPQIGSRDVMRVTPPKPVLAFSRGPGRKKPQVVVRPARPRKG